MSGSKLSGFRVASDKPFLIGLGVLGGSYLLIIGAMVLSLGFKAVGDGDMNPYTRSYNTMKLIATVARTGARRRERGR